MSEIQIRPYVSTDTEALMQLFQESVWSVGRPYYTEQQIAAWAPKQIEREPWIARCTSRPTWVAVIGAKQVGFIDLEPEGHIDRLYVHAKHPRQGIASALLDHVEMQARYAGMTRLHTEASVPARHFFARRGFRLLAKQTVAINGQNLINYRMEKRLFPR